MSPLSNCTTLAPPTTAVSQNSVQTFTFNISGISPAATAALINALSTQTGSISGCLVSCSSHGQCVFDQYSQSLICQCDTYFTGSACQIDTRPCFSFPCLNNGTCTNVNSTEFTCKCQTTYYGTNCENQINVCQNETCSGKGFCFNQQNVPTCKCFTGYSGQACDIVSSYVKVVKGVQTTASIIAFIVLSTYICMIISNDCLNLYLTRRKLNDDKDKEKKGKIGHLTKKKYTHGKPKKIISQKVAPSKLNLK